MPTFEQGDVIRVPFPYTDRDTRQRRPALVVSAGTIGEDGALLWVVMITSATNRPWAGDVPVPNQVGLPAPSVVRPVKIATIEARHADFLGRLPTKEHEEVMQHVGMLMGYRAHEAAAYDEWLRGKVESSRNDPRPSISNDDMKAEFAKRRTAWRTKATQ
ncbi:MAG: type II toxin-antitoxin system PemK/MazF family toxin [Burkholderiaceae bacterium]